MKIDSHIAWRIYNFINAYKNGVFGVVSLQEALDKHFENWHAHGFLREQIGN